MTLAPTTPTRARPVRDASVVAHLTEEHWATATRWLVRKALAEFAHERLLEPRDLGDGWYAVDGTTGGKEGSAGDAPVRPVEYRFRARRLPLDHWLVDSASITRSIDGAPEPLDALALFVELRESLQPGPGVLPLLLEEVSSTLSAQAFRLSRPQPTSAELVDLPFQAVESAMAEGHPCFVANSGRIGFDAAEYARYAPEAGEPVRLVWVAVRQSRATFAAGCGVSWGTLLEQEFDGETLGRFRDELAALDLDADDYYLMPVHPWQWDNRLTTTFAADLARRDIVWLGEGDDEHQAQQSIRTFFNRSTPERSYVKTALSVLNMGFLRGLSTGYMEVTPAINDWVAEVVRGDPELAARRFDVLREHASLGYRSPVYEAAAPQGAGHLKMLAALWRESPVPRLGEGERLATMASLLHVDARGRSFVGALVDRSGLDAATWLARYLDAYLVPVAHCLYAHSLAFMPHGENLILVLRDGVVDRVVMKDIGEEVVVMDPDVALPGPVERIRADVPPEMQALSVLTDVVDCFLRFLSAILEEEGRLTTDQFWEVAARVLLDYQAQHPELAERFAAHDLFAENFALSCLNRLQLRNNQQMVDLTDQASSLQFAGRLANPLRAGRR